jgi:hypothetical protein
MKEGDIVTAIGIHDIDENGNYVDPLYGKIEFTNLLTAHAYAWRCRSFPLFSVTASRCS